MDRPGESGRQAEVAGQVGEEREAVEHQRVAGDVPRGVEDLDRFCEQAARLDARRRRRAALVVVAEIREGERIRRPPDHEVVVRGLEDRERVARVLPGGRDVPAAVEHVGERPLTAPGAHLVADVAVDVQRLLDVLPCGGRVPQARQPADRPREADPVQRLRQAGLIPQLTAQRDLALVPAPRLVGVALPVGETRDGAVCIGQCRRMVGGVRHRQRCLHAVDALSQVTAHLPEAPQHERGVQGRLGAPRLHEPLLRGTQVVVLLVEPVQPFRLRGAHELVRRRLGQLAEEGRVPVAELLQPATLGCLLDARTRGSSRASRSVPRRRAPRPGGPGSCRRGCRARRAGRRRPRRHRPARSRPDRRCPRTRRGRRRGPDRSRRACRGSMRSRRAGSAAARGGRAGRSTGGSAGARDAPAWPAG